MRHATRLGVKQTSGRFEGEFAIVLFPREFARAQIGFRLADDEIHTASQANRVSHEKEAREADEKQILQSIHGPEVAICVLTLI